MSEETRKSMSRSNLLRGAGVGIAGATAVGLGMSAPLAQAAASPRDFFNVMDYGATAGGTIDDSGAIQSAINAAQANGGTVYIPAGKYLLKNPGNLPQLLLVQSQIRILGDGNRTNLLVDSTVASTVDVIRLSPSTVGGSAAFGWILDSFRIAPNGGTPARHAIKLDISATGQYLAKALLQNLFVESGLGGRAIFLDNSGIHSDGFFTSAILNNHFHGGMSLLYAGDSINIMNNTLTGPNCGIDFSQVPGARNNVIAFNNITSAGGAIRATTGTTPPGGTGELKIMFNQIEQTVTNTGPENAMIAIVGNSGTSIASTEIIGNNMDAHGLAANNIYLDYATYTKIRDNNFLSPTGAAVNVKATSANTEIGYNNWLAGQTANALVTDAGTGTMGVLHPVTLLNSWYTPDATTYGTTGATKLETGLVVLSGVIAGGGTSQGTTLFTLPVGLRPSFAHRYVVNSMTGGTTYIPTFIDVLANGNVNFISGGNTYVALDGISFLAT